MTDGQKRIERAYQRAMNIRDATPGQVSDAIELKYSAEYRRCYKSGDSYDAAIFRIATRRYLKVIRRAGK